MSAGASNRYDSFSVALHWLTVFLVVGAFILGPEGFGKLTRQGLDPATRWDIVWHESLGMLVFVVTLVRLAWSAVRPDPPRHGMAVWMRLLSRCVQGGLWLLMLSLPLTAMLSLAGEGHAMTLWWPTHLDLSAAVGRLAIAHWFDWGDVHGVLGDAIMWLAGLHAFAALYHGAVLKDGVLTSMLPSRLVP